MTHTDSRVPHLRKQGDALQLIVDGQPFIMLAGEVHNSSSSSLAYMEPIWDRLKALGMENRYEDIMPAKNWQTGRGGGPRKIIREDMAE